MLQAYYNPFYKYAWRGIEKYRSLFKPLNFREKRGVISYNISGGE